MELALLDKIVIWNRIHSTTPVICRWFLHDVYGNCLLYAQGNAERLERESSQKEWGFSIEILIYVVFLKSQFKNKSLFSHSHIHKNIIRFFGVLLSFWFLPITGRLEK